MEPLTPPRLWVGQAEYSFSTWKLYSLIFIIKKCQQYVHCVKPAAGRLQDLGRNHKAVLLKKCKCTFKCVCESCCWFHLAFEKGGVNDDDGTKTTAATTTTTTTTTTTDVRFFR